MRTVMPESAADRRIRHFLVRATAVSVALVTLLQTGVIAALTIVDRRRRRRSPPAHFSHAQFPAVVAGQDRFEVFTYGRDLYHAMLAAIDAAEDSIYFETYIWKDDEAGQEFKSHLMRKAEEGVQVYAIFDAVGNMVVPKAFKDFPSTIHTLKYRGIRRPRHVLRPRRYALDHRKLLVVDSTVAFIGGYNIGSLYATEWRDTHLRIDGPGASLFAQAFVEFWNRYGPPKDPIERRYPHPYGSSLLVRSNDAMRFTFPIRDTYLTGIDGADHKIRLTSAYFIPDHVVLNALVAAARRGVDVQVLVPWISNHVVADWASHAYFTQCLEAGVRIFGYRDAMIHAKTATVDGQVTTIGTANIDRLSSVGNFELNAVVVSPDLADQMERIFEADKTNAFELTLEGWQSRPWYVKASEQVIKPLRIVL